MLLELLKIMKITKDLNEKEEEEYSKINRESWDFIAKQLNTLEMSCSHCDEFKSIDVDELLQHEQKCVEINIKDFNHAYSVLHNKGVIEPIRSKFTIYQCDRCNKVFKNKYLLQQHNTRGKNPNDCIRIYINNLIKNMNNDQLLELKNCIKENMIL